MGAIFCRSDRHCDEFDLEAPLVLPKVVNALTSTPHDRELIQVAECLVDLGLLDKVERQGGWHVSYDYPLSEAGREKITAITPSDTFLDPTASGNEEASMRLWLAILLFGAEDNYYDPSNYVGSCYEILHILSCGIDTEKTSASEDASWSSFTDTEADSDEYTGLSAVYTCRCGLVNDFKVNLNTTSGYTWVIHFMLDPIKHLLG